MNNGFQGTGGGIATASTLDYLRPDINRPDLFEEKSFVVKDIRGPRVSSQTDNLLYTIIIIFLSAFIFITLVAWSDVLRSWYDSMYIDKIIQTQMESRIHYATAITVISVVSSIVLLGILYYRMRASSKK